MKDNNKSRISSMHIIIQDVSFKAKTTKESGRFIPAGSLDVSQTNTTFSKAKKTEAVLDDVDFFSFFIQQINVWSPQSPVVLNHCKNYCSIELFVCVEDKLWDIYGDPAAAPQITTPPNEEIWCFFA